MMIATLNLQGWVPCLMIPGNDIGNVRRGMTRGLVFLYAALWSTTGEGNGVGVYHLQPGETAIEEDWHAYGDWLVEMLLKYVTTDGIPYEP